SLRRVPPRPGPQHAANRPHPRGVGRTSEGFLVLPRYGLAARRRKRVRSETRERRRGFLGRGGSPCERDEREKDVTCGKEHDCPAARGQERLSPAAREARRGIDETR